MGEDFQFQNANANFKNLDKLIRYVNQRQENGSDVNVFYSTPSCYVKSLNEANLTWTTKQDDFFPYASDPHSYWTGYFTSRPTLKYFERKGNNFLQICKQLAALTDASLSNSPDLDTLREAVGIMQHHDAITGTEKQHVAEDYARQLTQGFASCGKLSAIALSSLHTSDTGATPLILRSCPLSNISDCSISASADNIIVTVYNPISRPDNHYVRLPVSGSSYTVRDPTGAEVPSQVIPIPASLVNIPGRTADTNQELVFKAAAVPPLGFRSYYISKSNKKSTTTKILFKDLKEASFGSENLQYTFDKKTGKLSSLSNGRDAVEFSQSLQYYIGALGDNGASERRSSGAYVLRTVGNTPVEIATEVNNTIYEGPIVREIHQVFSDWASQVVREYVGESYLEIEWLVGPIPIEDGNGKEVISRISSNLTTDGIFYTDSSGRETIQRKKNYRPTWDLDIQEEVAGNYYPITTDISINDGNTGLTVVIDRAQGGSSLNDGQLELMVHRRLLHDDAFGVGEALNETAYGVGLVARGTHWVTVGSVSDPDWAKNKHLLKQEKVLDSYVVLTDAGSLDFDTWSKSYRLEFSGLTQALPDAVQVLTLEPWKNSSYLLRLEHLYEKGDPQAEAVTVSLDNLFTTFDIASIRETTLGANQWLDEATRLEWRKETNDVNGKSSSKKSTKALPEVTLEPKQIRTFVVDIQPKRI